MMKYSCCGKGINKMVDKRGRDKKSNMQMVEERRKMKCEITTGLFSR
jgi:hypothetical protein